MLVYLNGKFVPKEEAKISVFDHGLLYGDGVFEGIRAYNGKIFKLDEHIDRLYDSAKIIMLDIPMTKEEMKKAVVETCKVNGIKSGYIRLVVTRGEGDLGLDPWKAKNPTVFIIVDKIQLYPEELYEKGISIITVPTRRNVPEALNPMAKTLNYLNNILAKIEARAAGAQEALMLNNEGFVAECTGDNIFMVKKGILYTPPVYVGVLEGITRNTVIELAKKLSIKVVETVFTRAELFTADEVFLTGTAAEIVPVVKIDGRIIGDGTPGLITKRLIEEFRKLVETTGTPIQ